MSAARLTFLPWVQPGTSARLPEAQVERLDPAQAATVTLTVGVTVNGAVIEKAVRLLGPGDVTAIDARQVVRFEPRPGAADFEPNLFPLIEFDRPDFPWLFTPAKADAQGRLRPWLVLVVVRRQAGVELRPGNGPSPVLEIRAPARPRDELPDLAESHLWAHAQVAGASRADLQAALDGQPARTVSRLLCPRRLRPSTAYLACVVPAFAAGRTAGLGLPAESADLAPAWRSGTGAPVELRLPVYASWEFRTAPSGDFEELVRRLRPRELPPEVGKRPIDVRAPGFPVDPAPTTLLGLEGALRPVDAAPTPWPEAECDPFRRALAQVVNAPWRLATGAADEDPVVGPPVYGAWHAGVHAVDPEAAGWLDTLNLDPRHRVAAALGTEVVQAEQEPLMAAAWEQLGAAEAANQLLRQAQLSRAVNGRYHARVFARLDADTLVRMLGPAQSRLVVADPDGLAAPMVLAERIARSVLPAAAVSGAVRRIARPRGTMLRRYARAGDAGPRALVEVLNRPGRLATFAVGPAAGITVDGVTDAVAGMMRDDGFIWVPDPVGHWERAPVGFREMLGTLRASRLTAAGLAAGNAAGVVAGFAEAARAQFADVERQLSAPIASGGPAAFDMRLASAALAGLAPAATVARRVFGTVRRGSPPAATGDDLEPIMDAPDFPQPMYAALRDRSPDHLLPGLDAVPDETVQLLRTNPPFVEAFMVGLNSEMGRELLWRGYPTDQCGTCFRRFWDAGPAATPDIPPIPEWNTGLGGNAADPGDQLVLLLRGELLRRYPGVIVHAVKAVVRDGRRGLATDAPDGVAPPLESHPAFRGSLDADTSFVGFDLTRAQVTAGDGWFFVLQQQPTEPRFGLDDDPFGPGDSGVVPPLATWGDLGWGHVGDAATLEAMAHLVVAGRTLAPANPGKAAWGRNAAHMAMITRRRPVRVAIHATELLP